MHQRVCKSGRYDGGLASASNHAFVYIDDDGEVFQENGPGRNLYEYLDDEHWVFAGHNAYVCKCGCLVKQTDDKSVHKECPLCGTRRTKRKKKQV